MRSFNWPQILNTFGLSGWPLAVGTFPQLLPNSILEESKLKDQSLLPLGVVGSNFFYTTDQLVSLIEKVKPSLNAQIAEQNEKLKALMEDSRVLFLYTDEELTNSFKPFIEQLMKKGVLFTYLDLSGKTSLKNYLSKLFPQAQLPCIILDGKTQISKSKQSFIRETFIVLRKLL